MWIHLAQDRNQWQALVNSYKPSGCGNTELVTRTVMEIISNIFRECCMGWCAFGGVTSSFRTGKAAYPKWFILLHTPINKSLIIHFIELPSRLAILIK
jgi:hypothetical protein